jgi:catechol 2,3-dioxygenase-like lactoylglutathione lyase family enzyme
LLYNRQFVGQDGPVHASDALPSLFHAGVTVSDMDRSIAFYADGLGLTLLSDRVAASPTLAVLTGVDVSSMRIALLEGPGGGMMELLQYDPDRERVGAAAPPPSQPGTGHVCLFVEDLAVAEQQLVARGGTRVSTAAVPVSAGTYAGRHCIYLRDPDGHLVELFTAAASPTS